MNWFISYYFKS